jgi:hypothetical protein
MGEGKQMFSKWKFGCTGCGCLFIILLLLVAFVFGATHGKEVIPDFIQQLLGISEKARDGINESFNKVNEQALKIRDDVEKADLQ